LPNMWSIYALAYVYNRTSNSNQNIVRMNMIIELLVCINIPLKLEKVFPKPSHG
jgi:hypothetical protein